MFLPFEALTLLFAVVDIHLNLLAACGVTVCV